MSLIGKLVYPVIRSAVDSAVRSAIYWADLTIEELE